MRSLARWLGSNNAAVAAVCAWALHPWGLGANEYETDDEVSVATLYLDD